MCPLLVRTLLHSPCAKQSFFCVPLMQNAGNGGSTQHPTFPVWTVVCKALENGGSTQPSQYGQCRAETQNSKHAWRARSAGITWWASSTPIACPTSMHGVHALCRYNAVGFLHTQRLPYKHAWRARTLQVQRGGLPPHPAPVLQTSPGGRVH